MKPANSRPKKQGPGEKRPDKLSPVELALTKLADSASRRGLLAKLGGGLLGLLGVCLIPELPIDRRVTRVHAQSDCSTWYLCGIYGNLCTNCGGGLNWCPSPTSVGSGSWSACCTRWDDGYQETYTYEDCCYVEAGYCWPFCANGSSQSAWCDSYNDVYWCTIAVSGGACP